MAVDRSAIARGIERVPLQPQAAPVNTFVQAALPQRSNLMEVGEALGALSEELHALAARQKAARDKEKDKQDADDKLLGELAAVKGGQMPAGASEGFVEGYGKATGQTMGVKLSTKFFADYDTWDGKNGTDPAAFDQFFAGWLTQNINTTDPNVLRGLLPELRQLSQAAEVQWQKDLGDNLYNGLQRETAVMFNTTIDQARLAGAGEATGTDVDALWGNLDAIWTKANGMLRQEDAYKLLVDSITTKALEADSYDEGMAILGLLDRVPSGMEYALKDEPYGAEQRLKIEGMLDTDRRQQRSDESTAAQEERRELLWGAYDSAFQFMLDPKNRGKPLPEEILQQGSKGDPTFRLDMINAQKAFLEQGHTEDPAAVNQLYKDIIGGAGPAAVQQAFLDGTIKSDQTLRTALSFIESMKGGAKENPTVGKITSGTTYSTGVKMITQGLAPNEMDFTNPWESTSPEVLAALADYELSLMLWAMENPNATPADIIKVQRDFAAIIGQGITGGGAFGGGTYQRPQDVEEALGPNPLAPPPAQPQPQPQPTGGDQPQQPAAPASGAPAGAQPATPAPVAPTLTPVPEQERTALRETLTPDQMVQIEQRAQELGVTPDEVIDAMIRYRQSQAAPTEAPQGQQAPPAGGRRLPPAAPQGQDLDVDASARDAIEGTAERPIQLASLAPDAGVQELQQQQQPAAPPDAANDPAAVSVLEGFLKDKGGLSDIPDLTDEAAVSAWLKTQVGGAGVSADTPAGDSISGFVRGIPEGAGPLQVAQTYLGHDEGDPTEAAALGAFFKQYGGSATDNINPDNLTSAKNAWCAVFVNAVLGASGIKGSGSAAARSFLEWGSEVKEGKAKPGDVIVFPRGKGWQGHVGIIAEIDYANDTVKVLGGNQSAKGSTGQVNIKTFKLSSALGIRRGKPLTMIASQ